MKAPESFDVAENHAVFRPTAHGPLEQAVELVTSAITFAREQKIGRLLVVTNGLTGFESPSISARYFFVSDWARASGGFVRLALVARPEMIDPGKFGVIVATNRGLTADVFTSEEEALAWLTAN